MLADVNWTAIGSFATAVAAAAAVVGVLVSVRGSKQTIVDEVRLNRAGISNVSDRITTPGDLPPIGQAAADILSALNDHAEEDSRQFDETRGHLKPVKRVPAKREPRVAKKT
jgi:hypothetical protein